MPKAKTKFYYRSILRCKSSLKLENRRVDLEPRGYRGDCQPILEADFEDPRFDMNRSLIFEVITEAEAKEIISKQSINQQHFHPAHAAIQNELGININQIRVAEQEEAQGISVGKINPDGSIQRNLVTERGAPKHFVTLGTQDQPFHGEGRVTQDEVLSQGNVVDRAPEYENLKVKIEPVIKDNSPRQTPRKPRKSS
jgi:hypothetical protein